MQQRNSLQKLGRPSLLVVEFSVRQVDVNLLRSKSSVVIVNSASGKLAKVSFVAQGWAEQQNPSIVGITFPNEAPRPVELKPATSPTPPSQPPPEALGSTAPKPPTAPQPPISDAAKITSNPMKASIEESESLSEEEFKEALEYAKKLREGIKE
jgi:hypothetical protein